MKKENSIFLITTIRRIEKTRTLGFFYTLEEAQNLVLHNYGDINENGYYLYCVIEELQPGIYNPAINEYWYKWTKLYKKYDIMYCNYLEIDKPKKFSNIVCFGMG